MENEDLNLESVTIFPSRYEREYEEIMLNGKERRNWLELVRLLIIVALLLAIFCGGLFDSSVTYDRKSAHLFRQGLCAADARYESKYAVVFDAGSTGSRVHVYEFQFCGPKLLNLVDEVFDRTQPGLSAFPEDPDEAVETLIPLLKKAWRRVPRKLRRCTPIVLKATAGLRLLPSDKVANILGSVRSWLDDQPFHLPQSNSGFSSEPVSVIDGSEEAISAWISVNFLQGHIGPETDVNKRHSPGTSVVLEMGGGSSQIVFDQKMTTSSELPGSVVDLNFFGQKYQIYQHSFLGYGLIEARKAIKLLFLEMKDTHFPCFKRGFEEVFEDKRLNGNSAGWYECQKLVKRALFTDSKKECLRKPCSIDGVHQPPIPADSKIFALSFINDRAVDLGIDGSREKGFTLADFRGRGENICSNDGAGLKLYNENPNICLDLVFIYSLLRDGYGIDESRIINSGQTIGGYETGWTLGSALSVVESAPNYCHL